MENEVIWKFNCKCPVRHHPRRLVFTGCDELVTEEKGLCDNCKSDCYESEVKRYGRN